MLSKHDLLLMQYYNNLCRKRYQSVAISYWTSAPPMLSSLTLPSLQDWKTTNSLKYNWYTDENTFSVKAVKQVRLHALSFRFFPNSNHPLFQSLEPLLTHSI